MKPLVTLGPHLTLILADAYEIKPRDVLQDSEALQLWCWTGLELLAYMREKYGWHASTAVYYVAALRRALDAAGVSDTMWPLD